MCICIYTYLLNIKKYFISLHVELVSSFLSINFSLIIMPNYHFTKNIYKTHEDKYITDSISLENNFVALIGILIDSIRKIQRHL